MARAAVKGELRARLARDRGDDADREFFGLKHRTLFDVDLDVTEQIARRVRTTRQHERLSRRRERFERRAHAEAGGIGELEIGVAKLAAVAFATEVGAGETHAFFLGKTEHFDGKRQRDATATQFGERDDRQHHAERTVKTSGVAHRVEVRAEQQRAGARRSGRFEATDEITHGVFAGRETGGAHPRSDERVGAPHRGREKRARELAGLVGDLGEFGEVTAEELSGGVHQLPRYVL